MSARRRRRRNLLDFMAEIQRQERRVEFRMAYPAHRETLATWGEAAWTASDLLHRPGSRLAAVRGFAVALAAPYSEADVIEARMASRMASRS